MKLSKKADYALKAVRILSKLSKGELNSIYTIARKGNIPREFLAKILQDLMGAGIVVAFKGVKGGYRLTRPADKISYLDVIEAMNGPLQLTLCIESGKCSCYSVDDYCRMHQFWVTQQKVFKNALRKQRFGTKRYVRMKS